MRGIKVVRGVSNYKLQARKSELKSHTGTTALNQPLAMEPSRSLLGKKSPGNRAHLVKTMGLWRDYLLNDYCVAYN